MIKLLILLNQLLSISNQYQFLVLLLIFLLVVMLSQLFIICVNLQDILLLQIHRLSKQWTVLLVSLVQQQALLSLFIQDLLLKSILKPPFPLLIFHRLQIMIFMSSLNQLSVNPQSWKNHSKLQTYQKELLWDFLSKVSLTVLQLLKHCKES